MESLIPLVRFFPSPPFRVRSWLARPYKKYGAPKTRPGIFLNHWRIGMLRTRRICTHLVNIRPFNTQLSALQGITVNSRGDRILMIMIIMIIIITIIYIIILVAHLFVCMYVCMFVCMFANSSETLGPIYFIFLGKCSAHARV